MVIRHRVKEHVRRRNPVRSYIRGSGSRVCPYSGTYSGNPHLKYPSAGIKHEGALKDEGYFIDESEEKREKALRKSVTDYGYEKTVQRLNALIILNKNAPGNLDKLVKDHSYLQREYHRQLGSPKVVTWHVHAMTGRHMGRYTKVVYADGSEIKFLDRLSHREAIKQADQRLRSKGELVTRTA